MNDVYIPAPGAVSPEPITTPTTTPAAPAETVAPSADSPVPPQADKPAGTEDTQQKETEAKTEKPPETEASKAEQARQERSKARWAEKNREISESRRREQFLLGELERLSKQRPDYSKITDPNDMLAEKTAERIRSSQIEDTQVRAQQEAQGRQRAVSEAWNSIKEDMRARAPDFDQVVTDRTPIHARAAPFIVESEKGGEIAYWLGKNPDAANDLYNKFETAPAQALVELGRIEARLSAPSAKQVSTAPKPAPVLNGGVNPMKFDVHTSSVADTAAMLKKAGIIR